MKKETIKTGLKGVLSDSYRYKTDKGEISMLTPCRATMGTFEIYCIDGGLFDDIDRFKTLEEAENRINKLLKHPTVRNFRTVQINKL